MVTISHVVQDILKHHVLVQEAINHDIVSYNKLALMLKPEIEKKLNKKVKTSAIIMAIRRTTNNTKKKITTPIFSYSIETIKTGISYIVVEHSPTILNKLEELYHIIDFKKGGMLNIIQGNYEVAIIINSKYKDKILNIIKEENILETIDDLTSISLTYSKDFLHTPGIIYDVSRFLAWEDINVIDVILTKTEFSLIIAKEDLMRCYSTLGRFAESNKQPITIKNID